MATCARYDQSVTTACRNSQPGVSQLFIANFDELSSFTLDTAGVTVTGITMSGTTKFFSMAVNKQSASFISTPTIDIIKGIAVDIPKVSFRIQGLDATTLTIYKELMQADVVVVAKSVTGDYYLIGANNGLSMSAANVGTGAEVTSDMGAWGMELSGVEPTPFYIFGTALKAAFESTYVA